eukprot:11001636-Karenia_brevis.AAC.1
MAQRNYDKAFYNARSCRHGYKHALEYGSIAYKINNAKSTPVSSFPWLGHGRRKGATNSAVWS